MNIKRLICFALTFLLVLSSFVVASAADDGYYIKLLNYDGNSNVDTVGGVRKIAIANASGLLFAYGAQCSGADGKAYMLSGTSTTGTAAGYMYLNAKISSAIGKIKVYKYLSYTYDVNFSDQGTGLYFRFKQYASNGSVDTKAYNVYVGTSGMKASIEAVNPNYTNYYVSTNSWHRVSITFGADGTDNTMELYIDGNMVDKVSLTQGTYGMYTAPDGWLSAEVTKNGKFTAFVDNITLYGGNKRYVGSSISSMTNADITIDTTNIIGKVSEDALGFAYEAGHLWNEDNGGATISGVGMKIKDDYIDYIGNEKTALPFKMIRLGGYTSNYTLWKRDINNQIYSFPYPRAQKPNELTYYPAVARVSEFERVRLALAYNPNAKIIICPNIWSAEPNPDNMCNESGSAPFSDGTIYPVKIMRNLDEYTNNKNYTIDNDIYQNALDNLIDEIRFFTCRVDDPDAYCEKCGVNWAQKRVDMGIKEPVNVECWELGNELYLRECSSEAYIKLAQKFIDDIRKVFPNIKLGAHCTISSYYSTWMEPIVSQLGPQIDYISTHNYYTYVSGGTSSVSSDKSIQNAMEKTGNDNLKLLVTEGGLNTFAQDYEGPSMRSIGMCTSFVKFFNDLVKLNRFSNFTYYGSTGQLTYNTGVQGGLLPFNSVALFDESDKCAYAIRQPSSLYTNSGFLYLYPLDEYLNKSGKTVGESTTFTFKFKYRTDKINVSEKLVVDASWTDSKSPNNKISIKSVGNKSIKDSWQEYSYTYTGDIPSGKKFLRFAIYGNNLAEENTLYVKDFEIIPQGKSNILPPIKCDDYLYNEYNDTALAEVLRYYLYNCKGNILNTYGLDSISAKSISPLAVETDEGIRLFLSNLSSDNSYCINLSEKTGQKYVLTKRFAQTAESPYSVRNKTTNDIVTSQETYLTANTTDQIILPNNSVVILDLKRKDLAEPCFTDLVSFDGTACHVLGQNADGECAIICAFYDQSEKLVQICKEVIGDGEYKFDINCNGDFAKLKLFKLQFNNIKPLAQKEIFE